MALRTRERAHACVSVRVCVRPRVNVRVYACLWRAVWKVGSCWYESYTFANGSASFTSTYILFNPIVETKIESSRVFLKALLYLLSKLSDR